MIADLAQRISLTAALRTAGEPSTSSADESLKVAKGRAKVDDPPEWFGVIKPLRMLAPSEGPGTEPGGKELRLQFDPLDLPGQMTTTMESRSGKARSSSCSKLRSSTRRPFPITSASCSAARVPPGTGLPAQRCRFAPFAGRSRPEPNARPLPTRIRFTDDGNPGAAVGVGGALYPEWDVHNSRYRPQRCRVIDFPLTVTADVSDAGVPRDDVSGDACLGSVLARRSCVAVLMGTSST